MANENTEREVAVDCGRVFCFISQEMENKAASNKKFQ